MIAISLPIPQDGKEDTNPHGRKHQNENAALEGSDHPWTRSRRLRITQRTALPDQWYGGEQISRQKQQQQQFLHN